MKQRQAALDKRDKKIATGEEKKIENLDARAQELTKLEAELYEMKRKLVDKESELEDKASQFGKTPK